MTPFGECVAVNSPMPLMVHRVYVDSDGYKMRTVELPAELVSYVGNKRLSKILTAVASGVAARKRTAALKTAIIERLQVGAAPTTIAHELGCTDAYVRKIRKLLKESP